MSKEFDEFMENLPQTDENGKPLTYWGGLAIIDEHSIQMLEISDEEIEKASHQNINHGGGSEGWIKAAFRQGAVWYREQLKLRK
jgi:hypothetical protein